MTVKVVGWFALVLSSLGVLIAGLVIVVGFVFGADVRSAGDCESVDHPESCTTEIQFSLVGATALTVAVWGVAAAVGLLQGRPWARTAVMVTHSVWAVAFAGYFLSVAAFDPAGLDVAGAVIGLILVGAFVAIVASAARLPKPRRSGRLSARLRGPR